MRYCTHCAAPVQLRVPEGDDRPRYVCTGCNTIHYQNPKMVAGCIPEWGQRVLLCRRGIEPRHGLWTVPAGFMENDETTAQAAARETLEEANARVRIEGLFAVVDIPHINQVYLMFRGALLDDGFSAGAETLEVRLFEEHEVPWHALAFPSVHFTLERYFADRRRGEFRVHTGDLRRPPGARSEQPQHLTGAPRAGGPEGRSSDG